MKEKDADGPSHSAVPEVLKYVITCMVQNVVSTDVDQRNFDCSIHAEIRSKPWYNNLRSQYVTIKNSGNSRYEMIYYI